MDESEVTVAAANAARVGYLRSHGVQPPIDLMYVASLLEFIVGDRVAEAREFHERRVALILDNAVGGLAVAEEQMRSAQARATLLNGTTPRA